MLEMKINKKLVLVLALLIVVVMACVMTSFGKVSQENTCQCSNNCCSCCKCGRQTEVDVEDANEVLGLKQESVIIRDNAETIEEGMSENIGAETQTSEVQEAETTTEEISIEYLVEEPSKEIKDLTEGEKEARRQLLQQLAQQRELLYALPNSLDKMNQIMQIDAMMIENSVYDFSDKHMSFIGDSITEAVCGAIDEEGNRISYTNYVQDYLNIGETLNRGMAGRMFSTYGNEEYSLVKKLESALYVASDATVIFLGVNDYLAEQQDKRYGEQNVDSYSDAGYCGALRATMKYLKNNFGNQDIFFVLVYDVDRDVNATYSDATPSPSLKEFMDIQKSYAEHFGFHVIDIYSTGIMDLSVGEIEANYTADGLHPNDAGNVILAQHIAAELALYYSNK